jgi:uncharacterized protein (DUF1810 family)
VAEDPFDLERFVRAQDAGGTYADALAELRAGSKRSHWMWFVFPQMAGLGRTPTAQRYAVTGVEEARAYLAHPVLGPRLLECSEALLALSTSDPDRVLGSVDAMKLRSSMTLFEQASEDTTGGVFGRVLDRFYDGVRDGLTLELLRTSQNPLWMKGILPVSGGSVSVVDAWLVS